jgi:hypothetical protein
MNDSTLKRTTGRFNQFLLESNKNTKNENSIIRLDVIRKQKSVAEHREEVDSRINPLADSDPEILDTPIQLKYIKGHHAQQHEIGDSS